VVRVVPVENGKGGQEYNSESNMANNKPDRERTAYIRVPKLVWVDMLRNCGIVGVPHRSRVVMGEVLSEKFASGEPFTAKEIGDEMKKRLKTGMSLQEKAGKAVNSLESEDEMEEFLKALSPEARVKLAKLQKAQGNKK